MVFYWKIKYWQIENSNMFEPSPVLAPMKAYTKRVSILNNRRIFGLTITEQLIQEERDLNVLNECFK